MHDFVVFSHVERSEAAGAEHKMSNAVQGIAVKQGLETISICYSGL